MPPAVSMSAFPPSMRIILDHNTPAPVRYWLIGHAVETAYERGWAELINGELLAAAEAAGFEIMITTDQGIRYQQNLAGRRLALIVLDTNNWTRIRKWRPLLMAALDDYAPGAYVEVKFPFP